jgi:protein kinase-like protein/AAA domain-containing protein
MPISPYVVGQWVRGDRFYGRSAQIDEILGGHRNWIWLLGTRRIGKTSLLKQLEHLAWNASPRAYFPVFWDFQGSDSSDELFRTLREALLDAEERLQELGIETAEVEGTDLLDTLARLRRKVRSAGMRLLLLCDEVEELITLNRADPALLRKLRRAMQSQEDVRSVLASTIRLWALSDEKGDTSPFLHGFTPPLYIKSLTDEEALALVRQRNLGVGARPPFDDPSAEEIRSRCDNHPYLIQLVCKRFLESGDLQDAIGQVASDDMVGHFFSVDYEMLSSVEKDVVRAIAEASAATSDSILSRLSIEAGSLSGVLLRLENLGFIRRDPDRRFVLVNFFFKRWFESRARSNSTVEGTASPADRLASQRTTLTGGGPAPFDGRYTLMEKLGQGGWGTVFKARDELLGETLAIKLLRPELSENPQVRERVRRETLVARDLVHPNVLKVYHLGECQGQMYIAMKFIEGPTLAEWIRRNGFMDPRRLVEIGWKLASALEAAHARNVIHRDIKPQNILIDEGGEPHLADFGLARVTDSPSVTMEGTFLGTPYYASPEQASLRPTDARSDIYSLGIVLYEMATGRPPFRAQSSEEVLRLHREARPKDLLELRPEVGARLAEAIQRCIEKEPARRFQSASGLRMALEGMR